MALWRYVGSTYRQPLVEQGLIQGSRGVAGHYLSSGH